MIRKTILITGATDGIGLLTAQKLIAIFAVHFSKGFFLDKGGYEYALALFALSVSLLASGGGRVSVDRVLSTKSE